jgi:AraC family transcriptional regulator of arabinose operon
MVVHLFGHPTDMDPVNDLARDAGMSKFHFIRRYRQMTGVTPMADVRSMRVQHARQLIIGTSLPLKEIAELAGQSDVYSLSRAFRQCLDITPSSLRPTHRS